jgi:hypothetical protein
LRVLPEFWLLVLLWVVTAVAGSVQDAEGAEAASLDAMLAEALEANRQLPELVSAVWWSSDFYAVYQSAGKKADSLVNLYCWAHVRLHFVRAGDASPVKLKYWTRAWLELIRALYAAHDRLAAAWQENAAPAAKEEEATAGRMEKAREEWDSAIGAIDEARKKQAQASGACRNPLRRSSRPWTANGTGLIAHRDYPMLDLD